MSVTKIDDLFDIPALQQQAAQVSTIISGSQKNITELYNTINNFKANTTVGNSADQFGKLSMAMTSVSSSTADLVAQNAKLIDMQKQLDAVQKQLADTEAKLSQQRATGVAKTKEQIIATLAVRDANKQLTQDIQAQSDAYKALDIQYQRAAANAKTLQAKAIQTGNPEDASAANAASAEANNLNNQLKKIDDTVGQSTRRVGSYTQSFSEALKVLEAELAAVNLQLTLLAQNGQKDSAAYTQLAEQSQMLTTIVKQQEGGFTSVTQEIRNAERALQSLAASGLEGSAGFEKLRESTVEAAQAQKEFQRQQKLLEGEVPLLGALTLAAKGLAGAYAVGQGSISLFAEGNEKVEKELNKLVAILTILQGLREAYELINQAGAIRTAIQTTLLKSATAAQAQFGTATTASAVAQEGLTVAQTEATTGLEAETAALGETAVAAEGATVALGETEAATTALSTTLLASGIGVAIVLIAGAIAYLLSKIPDWIKGNELTIKQQSELAESVKKANEALVEQSEFITKLDESSKRYYENQLELSTAAGNNEEKNFAIRKNITEQEKQLAQSRIDILGADNKQQSDLAGTIDILNARRREAIRIQSELLNIPEQNQTSAQKDQLAASGKNIDFYSKQIDAIKPLYDAGEAARKDLFAANQKAAKEEVEEAKYTEEQRNKLILESTLLQVDLIKHKNELILNDERSTLDARLTAIKSNQKEEEIAINATLNAQLKRPDAFLSDGSDSVETKLARKKAADDSIKLAEDTAKTIYDVKYSYYERDKEANLQTATSILNEQLSINNAVINDTKESQEEGLKDINNYLAKRNEALASSFVIRKALIDAEYIKEKSDAQEQGKTVQEQVEIEAKHNLELKNLQIEKENAVTVNVQYNIDKRIEATNHFYELEKNAIDKAANDNETKINDAYTKGQSSRQRRERDNETNAYNARKKELEAAQRADINNQANAPEGSKERIDAGDKLSADTANLSQVNADREDTLKKQRLADAEEYSKVVVAGLDVIQTAVDARYENELNYIDRLIKRNNDLKEQETDRIKTSTLNQQEQAAAIERIDKETAARNAALALEQRKLKHEQAIADKAFALASAIEQGALTVVKMYEEEGPVGAAIAAVVVALQVAKIAATPIPPLKHGTSDFAGGLALVGDGYVKELIQEPGKPDRWSPSQPTIMNLAAHTKVIPPEKIPDMIEYSTNRMFVNQAGGLHTIPTDRATISAINGLREEIKAQTFVTVNSMKKIGMNVNVYNDSKFLARVEKRIRS